jgi:hypothetical protein
MKILTAVAILCGLSFSALATASAVSSTIICVDSMQPNSNGEGYQSWGYAAAVESLNKKLKSLTEASSISAPSITSIKDSDPLKSSIYVICVTVTK